MAELQAGGDGGGCGPSLSWGYSGNCSGAGIKIAAGPDIDGPGTRAHAQPGRVCARREPRMAGRRHISKAAVVVVQIRQTANLVIMGGGTYLPLLQVALLLLVCLYMCL